MLVHPQSLGFQGTPLSGIILFAGNGCFSELPRLEESFNLQWAAPVGLVPPNSLQIHQLCLPMLHFYLLLLEFIRLTLIQLYYSLQLFYSLLDSIVFFPASVFVLIFCFRSRVTLVHILNSFPAGNWSLWTLRRTPELLRSKFTTLLTELITFCGADRVTTWWWFASHTQYPSFLGSNRIWTQPEGLIFCISFLYFFLCTGICSFVLKKGEGGILISNLDLHSASSYSAD
jgi:hypothetical protein